MPTTRGAWPFTASIPAGVLLVLALVDPVSFLLPYIRTRCPCCGRDPPENLAAPEPLADPRAAVLICGAFPCDAQAAPGGWAVGFGAASIRWHSSS